MRRGVRSSTTFGKRPVPVGIAGGALIGLMFGEWAVGVSFAACGFFIYAMRGPLDRALARAEPGPLSARAWVKGLLYAIPVFVLFWMLSRIQNEWVSRIAPVAVMFVLLGLSYLRDRRR